MRDWFLTQLTPFAPGFWLAVGLLSEALLLSAEPLIPRTWRLRLWVALWVLVPYLGLLLGGLSPRLMGLTGIDWSQSLGLGLGIAFAIVCLLVVVRAMLEMGTAHSPPDEPARRDLLGSVVLWSGVTQFHWAFLRGGLWEALLSLPTQPDLPGYWAVWGAAAIALVQLIWSRPVLAVLLVQLATLATTGILFFYTRNFWLCWAFHAALQFAAAPALAPSMRPGRHEAIR